MFPYSPTEKDILCSYVLFLTSTTTTVYVVLLKLARCLIRRDPLFVMVYLFVGILAIGFSLPILSMNGWPPDQLALQDILLNFGLKWQIITPSSPSSPRWYSGQTSDGGNRFDTICHIAVSESNYFRQQCLWMGHFSNSDEWISTLQQWVIY